MLDDDMEARGLPIVRKTEEIIKYFNPSLWIIENPSGGKMKDYLKHLPHYDIDYCMYSDWGYKKPTRIWTNKEGFNAKKCNRQCGNMEGNKHKTTLSNSSRNINMRYRVPPQLIEDLLKKLN